MTSGDWLPAQAPFDVVRRGYSPEQVTAHLERLEYDLRITTANRDATNQRLNELGAQLAAAQSEADTLRAQLDRSALEPVSMGNLSDRMQRMIRLAEEEASEIRARAEADADRQRGQLDSSLADAADARSAFDAERERTRKQLAEQVNGLIAEAGAEADDTRLQAQDEAARLLSEANVEADQTVAHAREQADNAVNEAHRSAQQELADARVAAEGTIDEATKAAATLTAETAAARERADAESLAHRTQVEDDFEISMTARRHEANRVITEREVLSDATAKKLVADAKALSEQLIDTATADSEKLMQQATAYANALVNRASAESHQRVADADEAVLALQTLRQLLTDQLTALSGHLEHIRDLAGSAPALITPPPTEAGRPLTTDFPSDPAERPTPVDLPEAVFGGQDAAADFAVDADGVIDTVDAPVENDAVATDSGESPAAVSSVPVANGSIDPAEVTGAGSGPRGPRTRTRYRGRGR